MELKTYINTEYGKPLFAIKNIETDKDIIKFGETKARALLSAMNDLQKYVAALDKKKAETKEPAELKPKTKTTKAVDVFKF